MSLLKKVLFCVFCILPLSCSSVKIENDTSGLTNLFYKEADLILDFSPEYKGVSFVKRKINGKDFTLMIDTGCNRNYLFKKYIDEFIHYDVYVDYLKQGIQKKTGKTDISQKEIDTFLLDFSLMDYIVGENENGEEMKSKFILTYSDLPFDGILGLPFLQLYSSVTFDYKNTKLYFDENFFSENETELIWLLDNNVCGVEFSVNKYTEIGLIDTGCPFFVTRKGMGVAEQKIPSYEDYYNEVEFYKDKDFDKEFSVSEIKINEKTIIDFFSIPYDSEIGDTNLKARYFNKYCSSLGYEIWKNRKIQLDFKNDKFRFE
ncbi:MAG: hypothetical protein HUK25_09520 [Treponema sp.]|nr:hypothetical protein [Clostridia bacterium]MCF0242867.1 hypothetical protein [Treponema sp.]